jgi:hypothetical protein
MVMEMQMSLRNQLRNQVRSTGYGSRNAKNHFQDFGWTLSLNTSKKPASYQIRKVGSHSECIEAPSLPFVKMQWCEMVQDSAVYEKQLSFLLEGIQSTSPELTGNILKFIEGESPSSLIEEMERQCNEVTQKDYGDHIKMVRKVSTKYICDDSWSKHQKLLRKDLKPFKEQLARRYLDLSLPKRSSASTHKGRL